MRVIKDFSGNYDEDPTMYLEFESLNSTKNVDLYIGTDIKYIDYESTNLKILFATEEQINDINSDWPFGFPSPVQVEQWDSIFDKILSISPIANKRKNREYVFFPFNDKYEPKNKQKIWDVIYTGYAVPNGHIQNIINVLPKFNYRFVSFSNPVATNINSTYIEKLQLVANSKISIVHNLINEDTPQLKTRPFEAAFCKTLILCKYDRFKSLEKWFNPNEDFVYYYDDSELEYKIKDILQNYDNYQNIINNAYNKAKNNYTIKNFIENYL